MTQWANGVNIGIRNNQRLIRIPRKKIQRLAEKVLKDFKYGGRVRLNILFLDDKKITELNRRFLGKENATDVLAFSMKEGRILKGDPSLLGDIAISTETALRQAKRFRSNVDRELALYVVHGMLHLLGYRDRHRHARLRMRRKERELLKKCQDEV